MSELIQKNDSRSTIRWKLLTGASSLALAAYVLSATVSEADDASRPPIWIELNGQFSAQRNDVEAFNPAFLLASPFHTNLNLEKSGPNIWEKGAKISFQPDGGEWVFSLGLRYGRSARTETTDQLTAQPKYDAYQNFSASSSESHIVLDFRAGKDLGLGRLGSDGTSIVSLGVRYAQFNSRTHVGIQSQPTNIPTWYGTFHKFYGTFDAARKFTGIGPSLSWDGSASIMGSQSSGGITLDWGLNGALLFGRQRAKIHHQTTNTIHIPFGSSPPFNAILHYPISQHATSPSRSKNVTVPNLGGFAAVSWRYVNAKVSVGYKADFFFNAIDGGIDARKSEDRSFFGPFASISVGIGD